MREEMEAMWQAMKDSHYQRTIEELTIRIRQTTDLKEALAGALDMVVSAIHAETGTLWMLDSAEGGRIYPRAVCGGSTLEGVSLGRGEGIAGEVIENGKSVIIKDCQSDLRWAGRVDEKTGFTTRSMICVPLLLGEIAFGSIQIINNRRGQLFDEKDLIFTEHLAGEIVLLLQEQNLLDDYVEQLKASNMNKTEPTFSDVFFNGTARDMERLLYSMTEFAQLTHGRQQEAVKLCKQLRDCFSKRRG